LEANHSPDVAVTMCSLKTKLERQRTWGRDKILLQVTVVLIIAMASTAEALPLYMVRSGRTCDNCHTDPTGWENPELAWRKCSLSCAVCHVNPTGGGMRTVSGRFYGQATLPMMKSSHRPWKDKNRYLLRFLESKQRSTKVYDLNWGKVRGDPSAMAFDQNRYAGLNADPAVSLSYDARLAFWFPYKKAMTFFPMQLDGNIAFHPLRYLTIFGGVGAIPKSQGGEMLLPRSCRPEEPDALCFSRNQGVPIALKDAFVMMHQLPYMAYFRAGRFLPSFGLMHDDHTLSTRRLFEMDQGTLHSRMLGAEFGFAANYPYFHLGVFRPNQSDGFLDDYSAVDQSTSPDDRPPLIGVNGIALATSVGYRELGWQLGASGMLRRRGFSDGGDTTSATVNWGFNPFFYKDSLPISTLGEFAIGQRQREGDGKAVGVMGVMQEVDYLALNGINLRLRYDFGDEDITVADNHYHRVSFGGDIFFLPGLSFTGMYRLQKNAGPSASYVMDGFLFIRSWY